MNPEKYVLKPQREGGGNNVYGKEVSCCGCKSKFELFYRKLCDLIGWRSLAAT